MTELFLSLLLYWVHLLSLFFNSKKRFHRHQNFVHIFNLQTDFSQFHWITFNWPLIFPKLWIGPGRAQTLIRTILGAVTLLIITWNHLQISRPCIGGMQPTQKAHGPHPKRQSSKTVRARAHCVNRMFTVAAFSKRSFLCWANYWTELHGNSAMA